jgi:uncharacterized protein GlcG (DUF336 family)
LKDHGGFSPGAITVEVAKQLVAAARSAVRPPLANERSGAFAVMNDTGGIVYFETINCALCDGPYLAMEKAEASVLRRGPVTSEGVDAKVNTSYLNGSFETTTTSAGGIPLFNDGRVVGAVGVAAVGGRKAARMFDDALLAEAQRLFGKQ